MIFLKFKTKNNSLTDQIFYNPQNHPTSHSEERLVNLVRGRECLVGLSILLAYGIFALCRTQRGAFQNIHFHRVSNFSVCSLFSRVKNSLFRSRLSLNKRATVSDSLRSLFKKQQLSKLFVFSLFRTQKRAIRWKNRRANPNHTFFRVFPTFQFFSILSKQSISTVCTQATGYGNQVQRVHCQKPYIMILMLYFTKFQG